MVFKVSQFYALWYFVCYGEGVIFYKVFDKLLLSLNLICDIVFA